VADARVPYVAMHWRGASDLMDALATYDDVVADVRAELARRLDALVAAGVEADRIVLDPGFGFAKRPEHGWALLAHLDALATLGRPLLVGTSRKRFLAEVVAVPPGADGSGAPAARDGATAATSALAAAAGAWAVRVHEARASADAVRVAAVLAAAREHGARV
jgi:dihydropteroate synthase